MGRRIEEFGKRLVQVGPMHRLPAGAITHDYDGSVRPIGSTIAASTSVTSAGGRPVLELSVAQSMEADAVAQVFAFGAGRLTKYTQDGETVAGATSEVGVLGGTSSGDEVFSRAHIDAFLGESMQV